jgi:hypothetical protein
MMGAMKAGATIADHHVRAFNTATASTNKIHDDAVARTYGFRGGLVPGVDVYAYMTHLPVREWGPAWLAHGTMSARFVTPVYDGHDVTVTGSGDGHGLAVSVVDAGAVCATGRAGQDPAHDERPMPPDAPLPDTPPPASPETLCRGTVLGTVVETFDAGAHERYLADVRERLPCYASERIAHPGWLLRLANAALARSVTLGPWIHVSSDVALLGTVHDGHTVVVRSMVLDEFERSGHRFVTLDVVITAAGRLVQRVTHTAIHAPRRAE